MRVTSPAGSRHERVLRIGELVRCGNSRPLGRGNQQLSPAVLRLVGLENVEVVAGLGKLLALDPPWLRVDTGDRELDAELSGYRRIHVAPHRTLVCRVAA